MILSKKEEACAVKHTARAHEQPSPEPFQVDLEQVAAHRNGENAHGEGLPTECKGPTRGSSRTEQRPCPAELNPPSRLRGPHPFTSQRFYALLNSLLKVIFNFPLRYLSTIGLVPVFSLRWSLPPTLGCIPKQPDSEKTGPQRDGGRYRPHTVHGMSDTRQAIFHTPHVPNPPVGWGFSAGLFPLRSSLLRESLLVSFPLLSNMLKFSGLSRLI